MDRTEIRSQISPFLKWAGGKRWLVNNYDHLLPKKYNRYIEPFLGSGAVFFYLKPKKAILSDLNSDLILTYKSIKSDWKLVERYLNSHSKKHSKSYYYKVRDEKPRSQFKVAANLIYLNRTCWNGLYRVNLDGRFNVPIGTKTNVTEGFPSLKTISKDLKTAKFLNVDFEKSIDFAEKNDFIFVDPPYLLSNTNSFLKYNQNLFNWDDMVRLRNSLVRAKKRGAKILLTHQFDPKVYNFFKNDFEHKKVSRINVISGNSSSRGRCLELLFMANL